MINVLSTPSAFGINDSYTYNEGSIGIMGHELLKSIGLHDLHQHVLVQNHRLSEPLPNTTLYETGWGPKKQFTSKRIACDILTHNHIDLIVSPYLFYNVGFNPNFVSIRDYPFIMSMCEAPHYRLEDEVNSTLEYKLSKYGKMVTKRLFLGTLEFCDKLIVVNEYTKKLYSEHIEQSKIEVIPYGVNTKVFNYIPIYNNCNILMVSRLINRRNIDKMIEALPLIQKEYPDTVLHIVGDGPQRKRLEVLSKDLPVIFHGNVDINTLVKLHEQSTVFCHLSTSDGWNQGALEAMSVGRPVICVDAPHNSMVEHKVTGHKLFSFDDLADIINNLFSNTKLQDDYGYAGRQMVDLKYNWNTIGDQYYDVYKSVVK